MRKRGWFALVVLVAACFIGCGIETQDMGEEPKQESQKSSEQPGKALQKKSRSAKTFIKSFDQTAQVAIRNIG